MTAPALASTRRATLVGGGAILLWASLAILTTATGRIPPFELMAMAFGVAFLLTLLKWRLAGADMRRHLVQPRGAWVLGVGGLFGYHFLYFLALKAAPPVAANLLNYLWPLLIVLFSAALPEGGLHWRHVAGSLAGLAGAGLLVTGGGGLEANAADLPGYLAAAGAAVVWAGYSVANRRFAHVPSDAVGGFCGATAALAAAAHFLFEPTVAPHGGQWLAVLAMGLGPVGAAFFLWDYGVKHGDIRALGTLSYATPLLSTLLLIVFGLARPGWPLALACLLIVGGAALGAKRPAPRRSDGASGHLSGRITKG